MLDWEPRFVWSLETLLIILLFLYCCNVIILRRSSWLNILILYFFDGEDYSNVWVYSILSEFCYLLLKLNCLKCSGTTEFLFSFSSNPNYLLRKVCVSWNKFQEPLFFLFLFFCYSSLVLKLYWFGFWAKFLANGELSRRFI